MLNLQQATVEKKKETGRCPGETRPVYPDKGCVGEVLGSEYFLPYTTSTIQAWRRPYGHLVCI